MRYEIFMTILDILIPNIIVLLSVALMFISILCMKWVKHHFKSHEISRIQAWVFILQFINQGFTILLINSNLGDTLNFHLDSGPLFFLFDGRYYDFSEKWF